jgi:hypothetical protein
MYSDEEVEPAARELCRIDAQDGEPPATQTNRRPIRTCPAVAAGRAGAPALLDATFGV